MYAAWNFDREIADLNSESEKGWQLSEGRSFSSKFIRDNSIVYRYAIDYNTDIPDQIRYREMFAEQGWQYINSTFNGWHYFRKVYDPALPQDEYTIYTDSASYKEMQKRWIRIASILGSIMALLAALNLFHVIYAPSIAQFALLGALLAMAVTLLAGAQIIKKANQNGAPRKRSGGSFLFILLVLFAVSVTFASFKQYVSTHTQYEAQQLGLPWVIEVDVKLPDFYRFEAEVSATSPAYVSIGDYYGKTYYEFSGTEIDEDVSLFLMPGKYVITTHFGSSAEDAVGTFVYTLS